MAAKKDDFTTLTIKSGTAVFISDIHFGKYQSIEEWQHNQRDYFQNWFFPFIKQQLQKTPDAVLIALGDVYDDRKSIDIDVNNLCIDVFEELAAMLPCYIINGNHDLTKRTNSGNSSLRSLNNINNLTIIKEPMLLKFKQGTKVLASAAAIPYLGDCNEENKELVRFSGRAEYALMHDDISKMKFDNGMTIVGAVDAEKFSGRVFSGHVHKRQETEKVVYVGSPYHLEYSDVGNQKGIYVLNVATGDLEFVPNNYSPVFQKIPIEKFMNMTDDEKVRALKNNYTEIQYIDVDGEKYPLAQIKNFLTTCGAKDAHLKELHSKIEIKDDGEEVVHEEKPLEELINYSIDNIQNADEQLKAELKTLSARYLHEAQQEQGEK